MSVVHAAMSIDGGCVTQNASVPVGLADENWETALTQDLPAGVGPEPAYAAPIAVPGACRPALARTATATA